MRRLAFTTGWKLLSRSGPVAIALAGFLMAGARASEPYYVETDESTVEVSVPRSARRGAESRQVVASTRAAAESSDRSTRPTQRGMANSSTVSSRPVTHRSVATRRSPPAGARQIESFDPARGTGRYPAARTSLHRTMAQQPTPAEEIPQPQMQGPMVHEGDVMYDNHDYGGSLPGEVFDGGYGSTPQWDGGAPYLPDVWHTKRWGITGGVEALFMRPHYSQGMGLQQITGTQPGATSLVQINGLNWPTPYQGAFRAYLGFRNLDCGDELRLSYWNFGTTSRMSAVSDESTEYCDFLCNTTANPGDTVNTSLNLQANVFDLDLIKAFCVPQPCQPACDSCDSCDSCDTCGPCAPCCPIWDVRWFAGLRFAQINHTLNSTITTANGTEAVNATSDAQFFGIGPRLGTQLRRYFAKAPRLSVYGRGATSLLVGNLKQSISNFNITPPPTLVTQDDSFNRVVPVIDLELGASWCVTERFTVSGGWLVMAWWDLGLQERVQDFDTSNILGFDGFFVRAEMVF
ncbi:MAG: hypothetical protein JNG90_17085 [Planctomycetaceae bacterium]|nr:hypothetical protein [Planctomycetaceae bacterium]